MKLAFLLAISAGFLLTSCKEDLEVYNPDFKGTWLTDTMIEQSSGAAVQNYMLIDGSNSAYGYLCETTCTACNCTYLVTGQARINNKHSKLWIGDLDNMSPLKINQEPFLDSDGKWKCSVEGLLFIRQ